MTRRELLLALLAACARRRPAASDPPVASAAAPASIGADVAPVCGPPRLLDWQLSGASTHAMVLAPAENKPAPVLVALHGRGEAVKGPELGAAGWPKDYALERALQRVCAPPLARDDFEGLVTDEHLDELNADLTAHPWSGLIVACPYLPDLDLRDDATVATYGRWITDVLLPRVHAELPCLPATGIDGVSLGGNVALRVGLNDPKTFAAVGALQPAIDGPRVTEIVSLAKSARAVRPKLALRLTTSDDDYYRDITHALSSGWKDAGLAHDFGQLPGPHDYIFNRGAGSYEMLLWHRRALNVA